MNDTQMRRLVKELKLFQGLEQEDVIKIVSKGLTQRVVKGEVLFHEGTSGNQMYVVLGGKIGIFKKQDLIATLHVGDMFGEMALVSQEVRSASAVAMEDSYLFVLSETIFHKLMTKRVSIQILMNIVHTLSTRLREMNAKLAH